MDKDMMAPLDLLRPTQGAIGHEYARLKLVQTVEHEDAARGAFMRERAIKVVRAPDTFLYVIDHHHWARAWSELGMREMPVRLEEDFGSLTADDFIAQMHAHGWFHPYDETGRLHALGDLPQSIPAMPDDPYQSLAVFVRYAGVFENIGAFNAKFAWADYFRARIKGEFASIAGFAAALAQAIKLSREPEAARLPGYRSH